MKKYILALDLGTTGNRAILFNKNQKVVTKAYQEFRQYFPKPGWVEHDPDEIWKSTLSVIKKVLSRVSPRDIAAIGITNQRETAVVWDKKTGKPVMRAIVWQCRRTQNECNALRKKGLGKFIKLRTGLTIDPYFSASKVKWVLSHVKHARARAKRGELLFGTVDSWIIWKLTGGKTHVTDYSNASRTMLFNIKTLKWDKKLCSIFDIPFRMLPRLVDSSGEIGKTAQHVLGSEFPITGVAGDQQAAMFAQGCYAPGVVKNTYGTGLFLQMNTKKKIPKSQNLINTIAWKIGNEVDYALEGSIFIGGSALQWLRDGIQIIQKASDTENMAKSLASNEGVYFVPALVGLGAPYWDSAARGVMIGITRGTRREHFARSALESIAYQTKDVIIEMERDLRVSIKKLQVDGGAAASDFLMQFQADILNCEVERPSVLETTALGAAGLAGIAAGIWKNRNEFIRKRSINSVFHPKMNSGERKQLYLQWKRAVERSRKWAL